MFSFYHHFVRPCKLRKNACLYGALAFPQVEFKNGSIIYSWDFASIPYTRRALRFLDVLKHRNTVRDIRCNVKMTLYCLAP